MLRDLLNTVFEVKPTSAGVSDSNRYRLVSFKGFMASSLKFGYRSTSLVL